MQVYPVDGLVHLGRGRCGQRYQGQVFDLAGFSLEPGCSRGSIIGAFWHSLLRDGSRVFCPMPCFVQRFAEGRDPR